MDRKLGQCCKCPKGELRFIFKNKPSGKYCNYHNQLRLKEEGKSKKPVPLKRVPIKWKRKPTGEGKLFKKKWDNEPHVSYLTGTPLGNEMRSYFFAHVLSKAKNRYPKFKLKSENIIFLTRDEHLTWDTWFGEPRDKEKATAILLSKNLQWQKVIELRKKLYDEYQLER